MLGYGHCMLDGEASVASGSDQANSLILKEISSKSKRFSALNHLF
jgi:hypothetical protein